MFSLLRRDFEVSAMLALLTILGMWVLRGILKTVGLPSVPVSDGDGSRLTGTGATHSIDPSTAGYPLPSPPNGRFSTRPADGPDGWKPYKTVQLLVTPSVLPQIRTAFQPLGLPGVLLPTTSWTTGLDWNWVRRFEAYAQGETVAITSILGGRQAIWTSNMEIGRQVIVGSHKTSFYKSAESTATFFYKLVWKQTARTYKDMIQTDGWNTKDVVDIPVVQKLTLAFLVIASCGATPPSTDGVMSVTEALRLVSDHNLLLVFAPGWLFYMPFASFTKARMARDRLAAFMRAHIVERKANVATGSTRANALTMLVKANQDESTKYQLDDQELIGNIFLLMLAGHGQYQNRLLLAANVDIFQKPLLQPLRLPSVVGTKADPQLEDYSKLDKVLAIFYEALGMFLPASFMIREATEDTIITVPNPPGEEGSKTVPITKGTQVRKPEAKKVGGGQRLPTSLSYSQIIVDIVGAQYNSRYFENPAEYRPSRWYGLPAESELFTAFSVSARACIGRKFAVLEATSFLTLLLRDWKILPLLCDGETKETWGARMKHARMGITLSLAADIPFRFERRTHTL
ncbi:hypothetical protein MSAN_01999800 [Mycena sanguinolenta]|uniref:Cytochrome P450 n=1 Tax=Mycena sanguinolenta TaxID=230812 RepID=A0A8H7CPJ4_9AGAR|nr:hypothetical protein MSAN_01999800 [Mycena sanguinolenta]